MAENKNESTNSKWKETANRFVVFLDIMGFKDKVARYGHDDVLAMLKRVSALSGIIGDSQLVKVVQFSDSIILFSKDDTNEALTELLAASTYLFAKAIIDKIPMKGAIAYGKISISNESQLFFGQPLIDSFLLQENEVAYYGIVCHDTFDRKYATMHTDSLIVNMDTPIKSSGKIKHNNLLWFISLDYLVKQENSATLNQDVILNNLYLSVSGKARKYVDETIEMYKIHKNMINGKETLPQEVAQRCTPLFG